MAQNVNERAANFRKLSMAFAVVGGAWPSCAIPLDDQLWSCATSADCGEGWQCDPMSDHCVRAYDGINGVFPDRIVVGMIAYLANEIPSLAVFTAQGVAGIRAYFKHVNNSGGIHGRKLELLTRDDGFDPARTKATFEQMVGVTDGPREVFLVCNTLGEPPSLAAAEVALRERVLLWAPGSGLSSLEPDPPDRYIFNYRPRYTDESEQLTEYLRHRFDPPTPGENIAVLAQGLDFAGTLDAAGHDIVDGSARALGVRRSELQYATYVLTSTVVVEPSRRLLKWMASRDRVATDGVRYVGLTLGAVWDAGAAFIRTVTDQLSAARLRQPLHPLFDQEFTAEEMARLATVEPRWAAVSAITTDALRAALDEFGTYPWTDPRTRARTERRYGARLVIAQVVPFVEASSSGALRYRQHLAALDPTLDPGEFSLESYLNMSLLGEALQAHGPDLTTETFVETLESFSTNLGVGTDLGFTSVSHQATDRVWGVRLGDDLEPEWLGILLGE